MRQHFTCVTRVACKCITTNLAVNVRHVESEKSIPHGAGGGTHGIVEDDVLCYNWLSYGRLGPIRSGTDLGMRVRGASGSACPLIRFAWVQWLRWSLHWQWSCRLGRDI